MLIDDIDLIPYQKEEIISPNDEEAIIVVIEVSDYTDLSDKLNSYNRTFQCNVHPSMSIHDFKRLVLYFLQNRPFFLQFNFKNSQELIELINKGSAS